MRHHRARSLHILALAPVAAIAAAVLGPMPHAVAAAAAPAPIVVTIDPAHGGRPDPAHPSNPFDVGAIALNGLVEKNVDLDVGTRLAKLLRDDLVDVVMTRTSDVYVSPATARADLDCASLGARGRHPGERLGQSSDWRLSRALSGNGECGICADRE